MQTQVKPWGNSQGIRLSKEVLETAGIHCEDILSIEIVDGNIILKKTFRHHTLEERSAMCSCEAGPYSEYEWNGPVGRERW